MILHVSNKSELITVSFMKMLSIIFNDLNLKIKYINIYFNSWVTYISGFFFSFQPFSKVRHSPSLYLQMFKAMSITSASSSGNALITRCLTNKKRCLQKIIVIFFSIYSSPFILKYSVHVLVIH